MSVVAIIQARSGSRRLPGKVLADLGGAPLLQRVVERAQRIPGMDRVMVATTTQPGDDAVARLCETVGVECYRGSENDVLDRYYCAARHAQAERIVRITADCPMLDPGVAARVVNESATTGCDYAANINPPTYPDGLDVEVMTAEALERSWRDATLTSEREHVTLHIRNNPGRFTTVNVAQEPDRSALRWTVDEPADLAFAREVYTELGSGSWGQDEVLGLLARRPELARHNAGIQRDEGLKASLLAERTH